MITITGIKELQHNMIDSITRSDRRKMLDLAELIETQKKSKSYCIQCYMGKCGSSRGGGGVCPNPIRDDAEFKRLVKYLNDPLQIHTIKKDMAMAPEKGGVIQEQLMSSGASSDVIKNGLIYTTCLFCYSKNGGNGWNQCKNSKEGRCGSFVTKSGKKVTYCYPDLKSIKHRIQIGIHINFIYDAKAQSITFDYLQAHTEKKPPTISDIMIPPSEQLITEKPTEKSTEIPQKIATLDLPVAPVITLISLTPEEKTRVNESVLRENIALKAQIRLLHMSLSKIHDLIQDQTHDIVKSFINLGALAAPRAD